MTTGTITKWLKKEGDKISAGDVMAKIETDKSDMDYEANFDGYLAKILQPAGAKGISIGQARRACFGAPPRCASD